jgi:hypothetical protein
MDSQVEWFWEKLRRYDTSSWIAKERIFKQAKEMERKEKLKHQLFIGKVSDVIGFEKTIELLKEVNEEIK